MQKLRPKLFEQRCQLITKMNKQKDILIKLNNSLCRVLTEEKPEKDNEEYTTSVTEIVDEKTNV